MRLWLAAYTYKFTGVAKRLHAKITIFDRRVYDHFKVAGASDGILGNGNEFAWAADSGRNS